MGLRDNIFANTEFCSKKYLTSLNKKGFVSVSNSKGCKVLDVFQSVYNITML